MKFPIFLLSALLLTGLSGVTYAQTTHKAGTHNARRPHDYMVMQKGKMMMVQDGKTTVMTEDMVMSDGTTCMTDGTCKRKDGTTTQMKEGDHCMILDGKMQVHPAEKMKPKKTGTKPAPAKMDGMKM
jgi:hypothetical protein